MSSVPGGQHGIYLSIIVQDEIILGVIKVKKVADPKKVIKLKNTAIPREYVGGVAESDDVRSVGRGDV